MRDDLDEFSSALIGSMVRELKSMAAFHRVERDDLVSILTLHVLINRRRFNADKSSWRTFVRRVVACKVRDLKRDRSRELAFRRRIDLLSLDLPLGLDEDGSPLFIPDVLPDTRPSPDTEMGLKMDLERELPSLPEGFMRVVELLQEHTQTDVARMLDMPLQRLRRQYIVPLRAWLLKRHPALRPSEP